MEDNRNFGRVGKRTVNAARAGQFSVYRDGEKVFRTRAPAIGRRTAQLARPRGQTRLKDMPPERPPPTDAEFRLVHGPWPRWMLHLSLIKLAAWGASVVGASILLALGLLALFGAFG